MKYILSTLLLLSSTAALAECNKPEAPVLPDGGTSELAAMVEGQKAVKAYVAGSEEYLACLTSEESPSSEEVDPELEAQRIANHNAAIDEMEKVAADFNAEIKEYKAKAK